jgi:hypothetical protein
LQRLHECAAQAESQSPFQIVLGGFGDAGGLFGALQAQLPLMPAFVQITGGGEWQKEGKGTIRVRRERIELIEGKRKIGVGAQVRCDL